MPKHLAIIMDGNGRWAEERGRPRIYGHRHGVDRVRDITEASAKKGIRNLTLFAYSSENWRRPEAEVRLLTELLMTSLEGEIATLHRNGIRLRVIGDLRPFGKKIEKMVAEATRLTRLNTSLGLNLAVNYGGHWDITNACARLLADIQEGSDSELEIGHGALESRLSTAGIPAPDLFIRTGGERRLSNFLLWQLAYTELYFTTTLWPDFDSDALDLALDDYRSRQRRFGKTAQQVA